MGRHMKSPWADESVGPDYLPTYAPSHPILFFSCVQLIFSTYLLSTQYNLHFQEVTCQLVFHKLDQTVKLSDGPGKLSTEILWQTFWWSRKSLHDMRCHQSCIYLLINLNIGSSLSSHPRYAETHVPPNGVLCQAGEKHTSTRKHHLEWDFDICIMPF